MPQWRDACGPALLRARQRLQCARVDGVDWLWPDGERAESRRWQLDEDARLLTPFDPVVWDRRRFEQLWGWSYRFEAYTPAPKRKLGYYAMPLLWRGQVIGWGNLAVVAGALQARLHYVAGHAPKDTAFDTALEAELARMRVFLGLEG